ncbi:MAG: 23S rRNA (adenine(2030)-N(6))-methyltransferase RlmJ [Planctomycetota bacterium]|nr:23S rRNA (adenine(2030)-N(6))-methyltransferase RlmJ [Planctomycetota bacterium]
MTENLWTTMCALVESDDGLPVRKAHAGSADKLYWWSQYLAITTSAMVGRDRWPTRITYVDLFAGPGVLSVETARYPGSGMIAANTRKPFDRMIFCELKADLASALQERLDGCGAASRATVLHGDCNALIGDVIAAIPQESLTLAFVDPPGLEASFETLERLSDGRNVDLLILVPTEMNA